jgi:tetratricopeptide (TPR) repeat protein
LLEEVARGGMGVVFRARQVSLDRVVALKMILAGRLATEREVHRFRAEAEAVAKLRHPNIVAIHEVGVHEEQHYFSMDLVQGKDLASLVREHPLSPATAARYVQAIAEAIHHAHQQGVLHRDLKPSNVLIDETDQPRITDFGLAKQFKSDSDLTLSGQVLGSPNFMPPEQAAGRNQDVGPQSDIYSLGAILYHLLTGRPPFVAQTVQATLAKVLQSEPLAPRALNEAVPQDLQTISLKCLEKDPRRRYRTARELADELGRFLRCEPIFARPVSPPEKLWRWCRRKPGLAASLSAAVLLLVMFAIGSIVGTWRIAQARDAERQARRHAVTAEIMASDESERSQAVAQFLKDMLLGVGPAVARGRDTKLLREILDNTNERLARDLRGQPQVEADLRNVLGKVYEQLGEFAAAEAAQRRALALHSDASPKGSLGRTVPLSDLANVLAQEANYLEAESLAREALAIRRKLLNSEHPDIALSLSNLGTVLWRAGKLGEAEPCYREALAIYKKLPNPDDRVLAGALGNVGDLYGALDRPAEAEAMFREALTLQKKMWGSEHPTVVKTLGNLANTLANQGKLADAEVLCREAVAIRRKLLGKEHPDLAVSLFNLACILADEGKLAEAETMQSEALAVRRKLLGDEHPDTARSLHRLGEILHKQGRLDQAEPLLHQAAAIRRKFPGHQQRDLLRTLYELALLLDDEAKLAESETIHRETLALLQPLGGSRHPLFPIVRDQLASVLERQSKLAELETLQRDTLALETKALEQATPSNSDARGSLIQALTKLTRTLLAEQKFAEAEPLARESIALCEQQSSPTWQASHARSLLGGSLLGQHKFAEAQALLLAGYEGLREREATIPDNDKPCVEEALRRVIHLYEVTERPALASEWKRRLGAKK